MLENLLERFRMSYLGIPGNKIAKTSQNTRSGRQIIYVDKNLQMHVLDHLKRLRRARTRTRTETQNSACYTKALQGSLRVEENNVVKVKTFCTHTLTPYKILYVEWVQGLFEINRYKKTENWIMNSVRKQKTDLHHKAVNLSLILFCKLYRLQE